MAASYKSNAIQYLVSGVNWGMWHRKQLQQTPDHSAAACMMQGAQSVIVHRRNICTCLQLTTVRKRWLT